MAFQFHNLDDATRKVMLEEVNSDIRAGRLYMSTRFSPAGHNSYPALLKQAVQSGDEDTLAAALRSCGAFNTHEQKRTPSGGTTMAQVPITAAETFAQGEFNRFYMRALSRRALEEGLGPLIVYRAMAVTNARSASEALIGTTVDPARLLADLRANPGTDTALGLPPGPNSGLTIHF